MPVLSEAVMRWDVSRRGWLGAMTVQTLARERPSEVPMGARGWHRHQQQRQQLHWRRRQQHGRQQRRGNGSGRPCRHGLS